MNWLAHIFVSADSIDYQLGNLLADPLKGRPWAGASKATRAGFTMHKLIDRFTDDHALVSTSKSRLGNQGYLRGVVVDLVYDHLLTQSWQDFSTVDYASFINRFSANALAAAASYPAKPREIIEGVVGSEYLSSYADLQGLQQAFNRVDKRLSPSARAKDTTSSYMSVIEIQLPGLKQDFSDFFPQLVDHFKSHVNDQTPHWLR